MWARCALAIGHSRPHGCLACLEENKDHLYDLLVGQPPCPQPLGMQIAKSLRGERVEREDALQ